MRANGQLGWDLQPVGQEEFEFQALQGEIPPYRLQLIRDVGAMASVMAEKGQITESVADDVASRMSIFVFGNRKVV